MGISLWQVVCVVCAVLYAGSLVQANACGQPPLNKIVGGDNAVPGSWPWQVSIQTGGGHFCGGSLINEKWVLSAAHCFQSISASSVKAVLGLKSLRGTNPNKQEMGVETIIKHEAYSSGTTVLNDIALVQLSSSATYNEYVMPVCLATSNTVLPGGTEVWVTGFGSIRTEVPLPFPQTLQEVKVPIVSYNDCVNIYGTSIITTNMICAGVLQGGKDACQGDSGGPLVVKQNTVWVQAGIVSFGSGCAQPNVPGVYTSVSMYQNWINSKISSSETGPYHSPSISNHASCNFFCLLLYFIPVLPFLYIS